MVIRHNFYLFFAAFYLLLLAVGLAIGFAIARLTGLNPGHLINMGCFCAAVFLSAKRFSGPLVYVDGPSTIGMRAIIARRAHLIALGFGLTGVAIDMFYYTLGSYYFMGEFKELSYWRLPVIAAVYDVLSWFILKNIHTETEHRG